MSGSSEIANFDKVSSPSASVHPASASSAPSESPPQFHSAMSDVATSVTRSPLMAYVPGQLLSGSPFDLVEAAVAKRDRDDAGVSFGEARIVDPLCDQPV